MYPLWELTFLYLLIKYILSSISSSSPIDYSQGRLNEEQEEGENLTLESVPNPVEEPRRPLNPETRLQPPSPEKEETETEKRLFKEVEARFLEVEAQRFGDSSPTTPAVMHPLNRSKNISRSIVPMMRKMFEKAKSCDPDVLSPKGDGTESSRYSIHPQCLIDKCT